MEDIFWVAKISNIYLGCLKFLIFFGIHDNSSKDTSSNTTFGRIRQLVEYNVWSKWTVGRNLYFVEMCLKFVENIKKNGKETPLF